MDDDNTLRLAAALASANFGNGNPTVIWSRLSGDQRRSYRDLAANVIRALGETSAAIFTVPDQDAEAPADGDPHIGVADAAGAAAAFSRIGRTLANPTAALDPDETADDARGQDGKAKPADGRAKASPAD